MAKGDLPVLIGVGQSLSQWDGKAGPAGAPSPLSLMAEASKAALADTGAANIAAAIDTIAVVRIFEDSVGRAAHPHGHNTNLPGTLARETAQPTRLPRTLGARARGARQRMPAASMRRGRLAPHFRSEANRARRVRKHVSRSIKQTARCP